MSEFKSEVIRVAAIEPIPDADAIELAVVGDYRSVVRKGQYQPGDLAVYLCEGSVLPDSLLDEMGLTGKLAGANKNRVKATRLRGCLSQGILYPVRPEWTEGQDVAEILGVTKYVQEVPEHLRGNYSANVAPVLYDFENIKKYPNVLQDGEEVVMTEKIHGTFVCFGIRDGERIVCSKGLGAKGFFFKIDDPANEHNLYVKAAKALGIFEILGCHTYDVHEILLFGEIYGVQDLKYDAAQQTIPFRVFDLKTDGSYWSYDHLRMWCESTDLPMVPELYRGPYSKSVLLEHTEGRETLSGKSLHIREGVVVKPVLERTLPRLPHGGRVCFKSINPAYLLRKNSSELE